MQLIMFIIKKLLKETIGIRKMSVESKDSNGSKVTNNYPKELLINAEIIDIIKLIRFCYIY